MAALELHYKSLHGEGPSAPARAPPATTATTPTTADPATAQAALTTAMRDATFMRSVMSGDTAALRRWQDLHQAAHPDDDDVSGVPPSAEGYVVPGPPPGATPVPGLEQEYLAAAHALGLTVDDTANIATTFHAASERAAYLSEGELDAMGADTLERLRRHEPGTLQRARAAYARLEREHPDLALLIDVTGVDANVDFVRLLARHG